MLGIHWFLPTGGDSRDVLPTEGSRRAPDIGYLAQVAKACDELGYAAVLTPCGTGCEDAWIATAALLPLTTRLHFLVAFRPALLSPTLAAQMASTYQRVSGGRLKVNIVTGAEAAELARFGVWEDKDTRYERTGEFLRIMRAAWSGEPAAFTGQHYRVEGATTREIPDPIPEIWFGGASPAAEQVAAETVDVYLAWGEPPAMVTERLDRMRALAAAAGRTLRFGIRFHVIARPTAEAAWAEADRLVAGMDPAAVAAAQADFDRTQSVGQRRQAELARGAMGSERMEIHPNVWAGIGMVRGGVGTALVGSHEEVADRIEEYHGLGFDEFHPLGLPAPRGGVLVRRGRHADPAQPWPPAAPRTRRRAGLLLPLSTMGAVHRVGLLMVGHVDPKSQHIAGDYPELFGELLAPVGVELVRYDLDEGHFPADVAECEGWICSPSRLSAYDDVAWLADAEELLRRIIAAEAPYVGICFGHQLLAQAWAGASRSHRPAGASACSATTSSPADRGWTRTPRPSTSSPATRTRSPSCPTAPSCSSVPTTAPTAASPWGSGPGRSRSTPSSSRRWPTTCWPAGSSSSAPSAWPTPARRWTARSAATSSLSGSPRSWRRAAEIVSALMISALTTPRSR